MIQPSRGKLKTRYTHGFGVVNRKTKLVTTAAVDTT